MASEETKERPLSSNSQSGKETSQRMLPQPPKWVVRRGLRWYAGGVAIILVVLWIFPSIWYTRSDPSVQKVWLKERRDVPGWEFQPVSVDKSAERLLHADATFCGQFREVKTGRIVRVFSAKRYEENPNLIGLFVHTPDRCWTQAGWSLIPTMPDVVDVDVHGVHLRMERRIFVMEGHRELLYFGGLVGGQPVPYRLDHNLDVGMYVAMKRLRGDKGAGKRAIDKRFWGRIWDAFKSRSRLFGPKQFIRISTPIEPGQAKKADQLLQEFLPKWLEPVDYEQEIRQWKAQQRQPKKKNPTS